MKYLITKAVIHYDESKDNKSIITPNQAVSDIEVYKSDLKRLVSCDRVYLTFEEVDESENTIKL